MSYYLKYRPQTVSELDLTRVREELTRVLKSGEVAHAYLFSGPKGTGKTSSARILAKVLNCEKNRKTVMAWRQDEEKRRPLKEPCNECEQCAAITRGSSLAVVEMDAASNRGIDDIRQLRERVGLAPAQGAATVYVIDEVHMLTNEAFNALLKTLEEPPEHAVFVLCTTEPHKLPGTVISRCTRVHFHKASIEEVMRSLSKAVEGEKLKIDNKALNSITERVDGSFRDGMKVLEQLAQKEGKITTDDVDDLTGFSDEYNADVLIGHLLAGEMKSALNDLQEKSEVGVDVSVLAIRIVERLREMLLDEVMKSTSDTNQVARLTRLAHTMAEAARNIKGAVIPLMPLEVAVVEWCMDANSKLKVQNSMLQLKGQKAEHQDGSNRNMKTVSAGTQPNSNKRVKKEESSVTQKSVKKTKKVTSSVDVDEMELGVVKQAWPELLEAVKPHNHSLEALLKAAEPQEWDDGWLTLRVYYNFHKEQLEQDRYRKILETVFGDYFGSKLKLQFSLGNKSTVSAKDAEVENVTGKVDEKVAKAADEIFGE